MQFNNFVIAVLLLISTLCSKNQIKLTSNLENEKLNPYSSIGQPLEVPIGITKPNGFNSPTPINQKYNIGPNQPKIITFNKKKYQKVMQPIDYHMIYQVETPSEIFQFKENQEYRLLQNRQFTIIITNPSEIFKVCLNQVFSDSENIKKTLKRALPFCINSLTKYPLYFNLYVTSSKHKQILKGGIFFNISLFDQQNEIVNKIWLKEVSFEMNQNHLKIVPFELKNCKKQNSLLTIRNPEKHDLTISLIYKYKKFNLNGQPLQQKIIIPSQRTFKFLLEGRDSTMNIITKITDSSTDKQYPVLFVPIYCLDNLFIEHQTLGIVSDHKSKLLYPIYFSSNSNSTITIEEIDLQSSSGCVNVVRSSSHRTTLQPHEKNVYICGIVIYSCIFPSVRNSVLMKVQYLMGSSNASSQRYTTSKNFSYSEMHSMIEINDHRYYNVNDLQDQYNDTERVKMLNYSIKNKFDIPLRLVRVHFAGNAFQLHWFRHNGAFIYPGQAKEEMSLQYIGSKQLVMSPKKYIITFEFSGNIIYPIEAFIYDNTLQCRLNQHVISCKGLNSINYGYLKHETQMVSYNVTFINMNPTSIHLALSIKENTIQNYGVGMLINFSNPYPNTQYEYIQDPNSHFLDLKSHNEITCTFTMIIFPNASSGQFPFHIVTPYQKIDPAIRFNFENGLIELTSHASLSIHQKSFGSLSLFSNFMEPFRIYQIAADDHYFQFLLNKSHLYNPNQNVTINFIYDPHKGANNLTDECCDGNYLSKYYLSSLFASSSQDQSPLLQYSITLKTTTQLDASTIVNASNHKENLLTCSTASGQNQSHLLTIQTTALKYNNSFSLQIHNPYSESMKYQVYILPLLFIEKPKDFLNYFKHIIKEETKGYFCFNNKLRTVNFLTSSVFKQLFRLNNKPIEIELEVSENNLISTRQVNSQKDQHVNFILTDYVRSAALKGARTCYVGQFLLYVNLLIETQILNLILEKQSQQVFQYFLAKEFKNIEEENIKNIVLLDFDKFYQDLNVELIKYCNRVFYPVFKFCSHLTFEQQNSYEHTSFNPNSKLLTSSSKGTFKQPFKKKINVLPSNSCQTFKYKIHQPIVNNYQFYILIANNYSKYFQTQAEVRLKNAEIKIEDVTLAKHQRIEKGKLLKHYFPALNDVLFKKNSKEWTHKQQFRKEFKAEASQILPIYLTGSDFHEENSSFYLIKHFELISNNSLCHVFSHSGINNIENATQLNGYSITFKDQGFPLVLNKSNGLLMSLTLNVQLDDSFNLTNPYYHKLIDFYLYSSEGFHLHLAFVVKIAENMVHAHLMKMSSQVHKRDVSQLKYLVLNLLSFAFICAVIYAFRLEGHIHIFEKPSQEHQTADYTDLTQEMPSKHHAFSLKDIHSNYYLHTFPGLATQIQPSPNSHKYHPIQTFTEDHFLFFKSLGHSEQLLGNESIDGDLNIRSSQDEDSVVKKDELDKSKCEEDKSRGELDKSRGQSREMNFSSDQSKKESSENQENIIHYQSNSNEVSEDQKSEGSISESILPDGVSVSNDELDNIDEFLDYEFGFEQRSPKKKKDKKEDRAGDGAFYYDVFMNANPLKKEKENPFPFLNKYQNQKKAKK